MHGSFSYLSPNQSGFRALAVTQQHLVLNESNLCSMYIVTYKAPGGGGGSPRFCTRLPLFRMHRHRPGNRPHCEVLR